MHTTISQKHFMPIRLEVECERGFLTGHTEPDGVPGGIYQHKLKWVADQFGRRHPDRPITEEVRAACEMHEIPLADAFFYEPSTTPDITGMPSRFPKGGFRLFRKAPEKKPFQPTGNPAYDYWENPDNFK